MVLPISLKKGDRDSQPGEQPINTLLWTENTRPVLYGQRLAWQIAFDHAIDPAEGVEPVNLPKTDAGFEGKVVIESPKRALEKAKEEGEGLILWTDGSKLDQGRVGAAVCWKDGARNQWKDQTVFLGKNKEVLDAELWAILKALEVALKMLNEKDAPVTIFCDSQPALRAIQSTALCNENRFLRNLIYYKTGQLQRDGHLVAIRWIPGHSKLPGNERADLAAKDCAQKGGRQAERWSSLAYIKKNLSGIRAKELDKWHQTQTQKREASRQGFYVPWANNGIDPTLGNASKKYASRFYQLKVGHAAVGTFLVRIEAIETPECWWCGEAKQFVVHLYTKCRRWRKERRKMIRELHTEGVTWQAQTERKCLAGLLANQRATKTLLRFLQATEIGGREGARERELEWEQKNDQAGEDLLG